MVSLLPSGSRMVAIWHEVNREGGTDVSRHSVATAESAIGVGSSVLLGASLLLEERVVMFHLNG